MGDLLKFPGRQSIPDTVEDHRVEEDQTMAWATVLADFEIALTAEGLAVKSRRLYLHYVGLLARAHPDPRDVTRRSLDAWMGNPQWGPNARKSARTATAKFFRWAVLAGVVDESPMIGAPGVRVPPGEPRPAPTWVYLHAMERANPEQQVMLMLARYAGLRCCEIAQVRGDDLTDDLLFVVGKGGKQRIVPIAHQALLEALHRVHGHLFPGRERAHVGADWISRQLSRILPDEWTAHQLRHTYASTAYRNNPDIYALSKVLGHSKVETTQRYTQMPMDNLRRIADAAA